MARLRGLPDSAAGLRPAYLAARAALVRAMSIDTQALTDTVDRRAWRVMRETLDSELTTTPQLAEGTAVLGAVRCDYDPRRMPNVDSLEARLYACYGAAADDVVVDGHRLDRLTVLETLLPNTDDRARRQRLFMGLDGVWRSVNGNDDAASPWRELLRRRAATWRNGPTPFERQSRILGYAPDTVRQWLERFLEAFRATLPDSTFEPWDLFYAMGGTSRRLSPRVPRDSLIPITVRYYRTLGADPGALQVLYDLDPRTGKDPVSFTTFGARPAFAAGAWRPGAPYISAGFATGGMANLETLLHETGHAAHIAGIRTRPAFADWPDADIFTEAIADLAADPADDARWQWEFLGDSAPTADNRRAAFFGVAMDACWALFEARLQRDPTLDPNVVWTDLMTRYLHVTPHPELSWWAMRGQLIDAPSYLLNYAFGAFITADLRARIAALHGDYTLGDSTWYGFVREHIYRFGLERSAQRVLQDFLGRPVTAYALLNGLSGGTAGPPR